jgi:hypothetical protein
MLAISDDIKLVAASRKGVEVAFRNQQRADFVQLLPVIARFNNGNGSRKLIRAGLWL